MSSTTTNFDLDLGRFARCSECGDSAVKAFPPEMAPLASSVYVCTHCVGNLPSSGSTRCDDAALVAEPATIRTPAGTWFVGLSDDDTILLDRIGSCTTIAPTVARQLAQLLIDTADAAENIRPVQTNKEGTQ